MPIQDVIDIKNHKVGEIMLHDDLFAAPARPYLLTEIVHWQRASQRSGTHSALRKGEVAGTTKKPFPQKGRGMARQGSLKNPHQIGGGVAFPPKPRDYSYKMPKAKRRAALACVLSARLRENGLKILQDFQVLPQKTRVAHQILKDLHSEKALIVDCKNEELKRSVRNLPGVKFLEEAGLNVYDVLKFPILLMTQEAVKNLEKRMLPTDENIL